MCSYTNNEQIFEKIIFILQKKSIEYREEMQ